jgi:adenylate cyclase
MVTAGFDLLLRYHMHLARRFDAPPADGVEVQQRSIGFVDLVGSTQLAVALNPMELADAFARFDGTAADVITAHAGRMVKLIGDEVMFAAPGPAIGARIALALIEAFADHDVLPPVRAALASGEVIARDGDYSGATVNRAARAVKLARPGTLLADEDTASALAETEFATRFVRAFSMKGFDDRVKLWRIRSFPDPRDQSAS